MPSLPNELWWKILADAMSFESNLAMVKPSLERLHCFQEASPDSATHTSLHLSCLYGNALTC